MGLPWSRLKCLYLRPRRAQQLPQSLSPRRSSVRWRAVRCAPSTRRTRLLSMPCQALLSATSASSSSKLCRTRKMSRSSWRVQSLIRVICLRRWSLESWRLSSMSCTVAIKMVCVMWQRSSMLMLGRCYLARLSSSLQGCGRVFRPSDMRSISGLQRVKT